MYTGTAVYSNWRVYCTFIIIVLQIFLDLIEEVDAIIDKSVSM